MDRITEPNDVMYQSYNLKNEFKAMNWDLRDFINYIGRLETKIEKINYQIYKTNNHLSTMKDILEEDSI